MGTAQLTQASGKCYYLCELHDDLLGMRKSDVFRHAPEVLQHWDLLARAVNWTDAKQWQLPARPPLRLTQPFEEDGKRYVGLGKIAQPARGGFEQWLVRQGITVARPADAPSGIVPEEHYVHFMSKAL